MSTGKSSPDTKAAFTVAPEVVYSLMVPLPSVASPELVTNNLSPDTAMPCGLSNPETSAFTVAPDVVYLPIVPTPPKRFVTYKNSPDTAMRTGEFSPEISAGFTMAPEVVYLPIVFREEVSVTNKSCPDTAMPLGWNCASPEMRGRCRTAPSVEYS